MVCSNVFVFSCKGIEMTFCGKIFIIPGNAVIRKGEQMEEESLVLIAKWAGLNNISCPNFYNAASEPKNIKIYRLIITMVNIPMNL